jgi:hypothetical protein
MKDLEIVQRLAHAKLSQGIDRVSRNDMYIALGKSVEHISYTLKNKYNVNWRYIKGRKGPIDFDARDIISIKA